MTASFPATQYWKTFETGETVRAGGATFAQSGQLDQIVVTMMKEGIEAGTERMRAKLYHDAALTNPYATGDWTALAFDGATNWRGDVPLNFADGAQPFVESGQVYYVAIEIDGYTRNGNTYWIGLTYDWPLPINTNATASSGAYALAMAFYMLRGVRY